ncbi:hypothetical protein MKX03_015704, partial [Papaver bracteatum]
MSWYRDPQLFIYSSIKPFFYVFRITKKFGSSPIVEEDQERVGILNFSEHLSLGSNKDSDYDAFKATFPYSGIYKLINSQGLVINWDFDKEIGSWSREDINSPFWSLPGITRQSLPGIAQQKPVTEEAIAQQKSVPELLAENQALAKENSELKAKIASLQDEVDNNK